MADWNPPSHTLDDYLHDIMAVLDALCIERTDVASFGARSPVAVRLAVRFPERVRRLYLFGVAVGSTIAEGRPLFSPAYRQLALEDFLLFLENAAARVLRSESRVAPFVERMAQCCDAPNMLAAMDALDAADYVQDVSALRCPTLVGHSEESTLIADSHPERFLALAPHAQLRYVTNGPNWLHDFVAAMEEFDSELEAGSERSAHPELSPRETEVLSLLATGRSNAEVAAALTLSVRTVERHITNIYTALNVRNRAEATRWAIQHGLDSNSR